VAEATSLARSLQIQLRVIGAVLMREIITRFGRDNLGVLWLFVEPMMFTVGVLLVWTFTRLASGRDLPIVMFCVTGYSSVLLWRNCVSRAATAIPPNFGLLYHRNVRPLDLILARALLEVGGATTGRSTRCRWWRAGCCSPGSAPRSPWRWARARCSAS
jgi:capsular polysaccharide transport system permease protein